MATIDPSIALGVKPLQLDNPMNAMAMYSQIQGAQQANQLNQMKMAEYDRARQEEEGVRNALARGDINLATPEGRAGLLKYGKTGLEYGKALTEQQKAVVDRQAAETKLIVDRTKMSREALDNVHTSEQYIAWHEANHADPILGPSLAARGITAETSRTNIMKQLSTPGGFDKLLNQSKLGAEKFIERTTLTEADRQRIGQEGQRIKIDKDRLGLEKDRVQLAKDEAQLKREGIEGVSPKEMQKREAAYPQATSVIKGFEAKSDNFVKDLEKLRDHKGLNEITGILAGRVGTALSDDGRAALALYNKVSAKGGFQALQDLRDASKTGGALGNVSNQEGKQLTSSFAAIDRTQNAADVKAALDQAIGDVQGAKTRIREAYDTTYQYKKPAASAGGAGGVDATNPLLK